MLKWHNGTLTIKELLFLLCTRELNIQNIEQAKPYRPTLQRVHFKKSRCDYLSSFAMIRTDEELFKEHYQMMNLRAKSLG